MTRMLLSNHRVQLLAGALVLTAAVTGAMHYYAPADDAAIDAIALYAYGSGSDVPSEAAAELAALLPGARPDVVELRVAERDTPIATAQVLSLPDQGNLIVGWQSDLAGPVLRSDIFSAEELDLVTALRKHLPEGSSVWAMPALSARLERFTDAQFPLADQREALLLPAQWSGRDAAVRELESRWLPNGVTPEDDDHFAAFTNALLAEDVDGATRLQSLAGTDDTYVILHVRDVFDLGIAVPDGVVVAVRDFPAGGLVHDTSRAVKDWARDKGHVAYAVQRQHGGEVRAYYLTDIDDRSTLLGQLLPFNTARIGFVSGTRLVFQSGGYWVYRLQPVVGES